MPLIKTSHCHKWLIEMESDATLKKAMECMGIQELKPIQICRIDRKFCTYLVEKLASLPTGYGKSIIFVEVRSISYFSTKPTRFQPQL